VWHAIHASTTTANIWNGPEKERAYSPNATGRKTTTEKPLFLFVFFGVRIQQEIDGFNSFPSKDRRLYRPPTSTTDQTKVKLRRVKPSWSLRVRTRAHTRWGGTCFCRMGKDTGAHTRWRWGGTCFWRMGKAPAACSIRAWDALLRHPYLTTDRH
jgi:hypothetical protein